MGLVILGLLHSTTTMGMPLTKSTMSGAIKVLPPGTSTRNWLIARKSFRSGFSKSITLAVLSRPPAVFRSPAMGRPFTRRSNTALLASINLGALIRSRLLTIWLTRSSSSHCLPCSSRLIAFSAVFRRLVSRTSRKLSRSVR